MVPGRTQVTVNNRLALALREQDAAAHLAAGDTIWETPDILSLGAWQQRLYTTLADLGHTDQVLLGPHQELLLWEEAIAHDDDPGAPLLRRDAAARAAMQAQQLCIAWHLDDTTLASWDSAETRRFLHWRLQVDERLRRENWMTRAELPRLLRDAARAGRLEVAPRIALHGFDAVEPLFDEFLDALRGQGVAVTHAAAGAARGRAVRVAARDAAEECALAANWAADLLTRDPEARIAIISPVLGERRALLERSLRRILAPAAYLAGCRDSGEPYNISLGAPLAHYPVVATALRTLRALSAPLDLEDMSSLLRSPFLGGQAQEAGARAALDIALREDGRPRLRLGQLLAHAGRFTEQDCRHCPDLQARLAALLARYDELPRRATPGGWAGLLLRLLETAGWPGDRPPDSHEYQAIERFRRLFSDFAALEPVLPRCDLGRAVRAVRRLCEDTSFQPRGVAARVQVLGILESAGLEFDAVWVMDMDDRAWPPQPAPNPLLPAGLQRARGIPHGSAARELHFAREITARLAGSAPQRVFSHALGADDREQAVSPLLADVAETTRDALGIAADIPLYTHCAEPGAGTPLPPPGPVPPRLPPSGGSGLLGAQSACPFSAIARYRLKASSAEEASHAADGRLRGELVHQALERAWHSLGGSATLATLDADELRTLLADCSAQAVADIGRKRPDLYGEAFSALERKRLTDLLERWFAIERERPMAFAVEAMEQDRTLVMGGLELHLRADRIDRLADGSRAVIDYKTGRSDQVRSWTGERPLDPQVPLYCIDADDPPAAALIARVRNSARERGFAGLTARDGMVQGIAAYADEDGPADWDALLAHWRSRLGMLAAEVMRGRAEVAPQDGACSYCPYPGLCRIGQQRATRVPEDADD